MLVLLQTAIPADGTVVEEGFSKLQVFLQQLIDWGVAAGGNIIGAILIFVIRHGSRFHRRVRSVYRSRKLFH